MHIISNISIYIIARENSVSPKIDIDDKYIPYIANSSYTMFLSLVQGQSGS